MKVIVLGATGTIGSAVADALAERHEVIRASRSGAARVDIEDVASLAALFDEMPNVDALVSCAPNAMSVMGAAGPLAQLGEAQFQLATRWMMIPVNLVRLAMTRVRDGGSITLTTGALATRPMPGTTALSMAGAAVEGFVRAAALEMPRGLRLNSVSPGWVKETMEQRGMDSTPGMPAKVLARSYVEAVEGAMNGEVIDPSA